MDKRKNNGGHSTAGKAGRPSVKDELKGVDLASPHVEQAFITLASIMINSDEKSRDRIAACKILIEYGCTKPKETIDNNISISGFNVKDLFYFENKSER